MTGTKMTVAERVKKLVDRLGKTSNEIAQKLARRGTRGKRWKGHCCPIANEILKRIKGVERVVVEGDVIYVNPPVIKKYGEPYEDWETGTVVKCDGGMNGPVEEFVFDFDAGKYPELDSEGEPEEVETIFRNETT